MTRDSEHLKNLATDSMDSAYSPYSKFSVGAALVSKKGNIYTGCNYENVSYGLTICAERNAIGQAITAEGPEFQIAEIVVTNRNSEGRSIPCSPCGACRQVIAEFAEATTIVRYQGKDGDISVTMEALLPDSFKF